jgi:hypothetical protein
VRLHYNEVFQIWQPLSLILLTRVSLFRQARAKPLTLDI